jgi:stage II sporulation protein AA (anti-sigma F factor antagonist)
MKVWTIVDGDSVQLRVSGELDALSVSDFVPHVDQLLQGTQRNWTVDLRDLRLLDSSGVVALVRTSRRLRELGGEMILSGATAQPLEVLRLLRLDRLPDLSPGVSKCVP